jgi:hypothetical protein
MNTKNLLALISVAEMLGLIVVGILSNKLAELINLSPVAILLSTLMLVTVLAWITLYKYRVAEAVTSSVSLPKPNIRVTQLGVKKFVWWLAYGPAILMLSVGAFYLSGELDRDWTALLSWLAVSMTLFAYPAFRRQALERGHKLLPLQIAWFLSLIYGGAGWLLIHLPHLLTQHLLVFAMISALTLTGLKYTYMFHLMEAVVDPWYKKLPEQ